MKNARSNKSKTSSHSGKRKVAVIALLFFVLAAAGVGWFLWQAREPKPPELILTSVDPVLRQLIEASQKNVIEQPKSGVAWGKLGETLHAAEFHSQARQCYSNAIARAPDNFRWFYLLGLLELQDHPDSAIQRLERATELARRQTDAPRYQLARALVERGRYSDAAPHLRTLLAANPNHAAARVELARVHLANGALREATLELQPAMTNSLTTRPALFIAAQVAQRNQQTDLAAQLSRRASALPRPFDWPDPVLRDVQNLRVDRSNLADQANALLQARRFAEAELLIGRVLEKFPDDPEGLLLLGRSHYLNRRCAQAEAAYRRHLAVQTNSLNGLVQLGLALLCQEKWTNAIAVLEHAVALKPDFAQAHSNLGLARSRAGDSQGALRAYRDALRCSPGEVGPYVALAEELANIGKLDDAKDHIIRAYELAPDDPRVQRALEQLGMR